MLGDGRPTVKKVRVRITSHKSKRLEWVRQDDGVVVVVVVVMMIG